MTGLFITLEGGDGVGKSTHARRIEAWMRERGIECVLTREPGGTELGAEIRRIVLHHQGHVDPRAEALLYAADRAHHIATVVRPALERGACVIQDRYIDSSIAYQGAGRDLGADEIRELSAWATHDLMPDLTVLLDLDVAQGRMRMMTDRRSLDRLEAEAIAFHERVRRTFLHLAALEPERILVVDASRPQDDVAAHIARRLEQVHADAARRDREGDGASVRASAIEHDGAPRTAS